MVNFAVLTAFLTHLVLPRVVDARPLAVFSSYLSQNSTTPSSATTQRLPASAPRDTDVKAKAVLTAYSSTPDQTDSDPFTAASGKRVHDGMIAANWLPFGTKVKIPSLFGDKIFIVEDRMNARYGYGRVDIWMDAPKPEVRKFGVKRTEVVIFYE